MPKKKSKDAAGGDKPTRTSGLLRHPDHKMFAVWVTKRDEIAIEKCNQRWHTTATNTLLLLAFQSFEYSCGDREFRRPIVSPSLRRTIDEYLETIRSDGAIGGSRTTFQLHESYFPRIDAAKNYFDLTGRPEFVRLILRLAGDYKI
ncbi:hypothetical protein [Rosistilla oblonga]|uniref:hypothetical protein n=1 Tax=Rosistilla oblonga TaxID=2527990 RepID=UPI003A9801E2